MILLQEENLKTQIPKFLAANMHSYINKGRFKSYIPKIEFFDISQIYFIEQKCFIIYSKVARAFTGL